MKKPIDFIQKAYMHYCAHRLRVNLLNYKSFINKAFEILLK